MQNMNNKDMASSIKIIKVNKFELEPVLICK